MRTDFRRIAIINRGEPAMRLIHAVRELNRERRGQEPLRTIALYTQPDRYAQWVRSADEALELGPTTFVDRDGRRKSTYLCYPFLQEAMVQARAEAAWCGWGLVSEQAEFAELCEQRGVVFIGPSSAAMRLLGDKIAAKRLAERLGLPVAPWSDGPVDSLEEAQRQAERLGYPLMIKAGRGGGGQGLRRVEDAAALPAAYDSTRAEALFAFGEETVFLERLVTGARHIEVQVVADRHGTAWAVGVRDSTIQHIGQHLGQRVGQRVLEEAPSPVLTAEQDRQVRDAAVRLCQAGGYVGACTVEFLYDRSTLLFMEVNTGLQVDHPVTEVTTGLDLVKLQLQIAGGVALSGAAPVPVGHAVQIRLSAEDADRGFRVTPGAIEFLRLPSGPGLRVDTGVSEGDMITAESDGLITKLIAHGRDRGEALSRLQRGLQDAVAVVRGGATNKAFLQDLLDRPEVLSCEADVDWLDRVGPALLTRQHADIALLQAAVDACDAEFANERTQFFAAAARGRPNVRQEAGYTVELRLDGVPYQLAVFRRGHGRYTVQLDGDEVDVRIERRSQSSYQTLLTCAAGRFQVVSVHRGGTQRVEINGVAHEIQRDDSGLVRAQAPAVVMGIQVKPGDEVQAGDRLMVLEAMKMEMPVLAPISGRVRHLSVMNNVQVGTGTPLLRLDPILADTGRHLPTTRVTLQRVRAAATTEPPTQRQELRRLLGLLRAMMLGYDVDPARARRAATEFAALQKALPAGDVELRAGEVDLLSIFADLCALFRRQPSLDDPEALEAARSEEHLLNYLRTPERRLDGLPATFVQHLRAALRHYGIPDSALDRGAEPEPRLPESLLRIFKSHLWLNQQGDLLLSVMERWLAHAEGLQKSADQSVRALLDQVILVTHGRHQALGEVAREVRYRYFDKPILDQAHARMTAEVEEHLSVLAEYPDAPDREARVAALVACAQPLVSGLARRFPKASPALRDLILEVLTRRYYRIRDIQPVRFQEMEGRGAAISTYDWKGQRYHLLATYASYDDLDAALRSAAPILATFPAEDQVVLDVYVFHPGQLPDAERTQQDLQAAVDRAALPRPVRRIVAVVASTDPARGIAGVLHYTYRPGPDGYREQRVMRGLHPMMAKRLHLWRLDNFDIERLPSVEDVYLFKATAHKNPKDRRLIAIAEVRDLTPVQDATGRVVRLPHLDGMMMEALAGLRRTLLSMPPADRPTWNRVFLYVWPPLLLSAEELHDITYRLAPATEGLGIEQVLVQAPMPQPDGTLRSTVLRISNNGTRGLVATAEPPPEHPLQPMSEYDQKVGKMRQRGLVYPYEVLRLLTPGPDVAKAVSPPGEFLEYDLNEAGHLVQVNRPAGKNTANIVVGVLRNITPKHPEGLTRVVLLGDPSRSMGSVAEAECRRINAALDLAEELRVPVEWFALSSGAKISMESGTENMDWIARTLRRIILFTQAGGEINVIVTGINVGAQPYFNAEATMLMHTRGILIQTAPGAMVLTGKQALDYSGSVSADDNQGIGGYERIMGPNGQAQYWARDVSEAIQILFRHYLHTYVAPGERFPRSAPTSDARERDVRGAPHGDGTDFATVGEVFSNEKNPGRKRPFSIRRVMAAAVDQDHPPLERWADMRDAEIAVVWDAHIGGYPVLLLGIESRPLSRRGMQAADGPEHFTAGTLFPRSSKKVARALNSASGNRPAVILANLSGFDGSPESMRDLQLEYGAEIGRAVVNFRGPIVFCVVSRYHGGAYVVFSSKLNDNLEIAALEGSYASVIGGAPAAAVVFSGEVDERTRKDPRIVALEQEMAAARDAGERARLRARLVARTAEVRSEKLGEVADAFDKIHSVQRALQVHSLDYIIPAARMRPYLVEAIERGIRFEVEKPPMAGRGVDP